MDVEMAKAVNDTLAANALAKDKAWTEAAIPIARGLVTEFERAALNERSDEAIIASAAEARGARKFLSRLLNTLESIKR